MALPKQIREQVAEADQISEQVRSDSNPNAEKQAAIDALLSEVGGDEPEQAAAKEPATPVKEPEPEPEVKKERKDYKQQFLVLQGKYNAEVPRLHDELKATRSQIDTLTQALANKPDKPEDKPSGKNGAHSYISPEEIEEYGSEFVDFVGRKAKEIAETESSPVIAELRSELAEMRKQLNLTGQQVSSSAQQNFIAQLDSEVENWRVINTDQVFINWLEDIDPYSGDTRKEMLLDAFNKRNLVRVKAFFYNFQQENAAVSTPNVQADVVDTSRLSLEDYVAPGQGKAGQQQGAPSSNKRVWTQKDINRFYKDVNQGSFKGRVADQKRIEADIVAAGREGRVR